MTVTAPAGFEAAGVAAGLKSTGKPDVAVVVNRGPRKVGAAVFTTNRAKANPIIWSQQAIADRFVEAVVLNSGGANCFTGAFGFDRWVALFGGRSDIREFIAFPKNNAGKDVMIDAPSPIDAVQLKELGLAIG